MYLKEIGKKKMLTKTEESDYDLEQDEFYSDLYVVKRPHVEQSHNTDTGELAPTLALPRGEGTAQDSLDSSIENAKSIIAENREVNA